jgi:hypothetical protein
MQMVSTGKPAIIRGFAGAACAKTPQLLKK